MSKKINDPLTKYYNGTFEKQEQEAPAVQGKMQPVPDCGETSYNGSGRLAGRKALVTGGDSGIGRAAAIAFAKKARMWLSTTCLLKKKMPKK